MSESLKKRLASWLGLWRENYANVPEEHSNAWKSNFDKYSGTEEGDAIAVEIEKELPDYTVERDYRSYLKRPNI